ncbi:rod shape-determining protein MreD [Phaeovibrio sulfidiphilus]|uniref:Rod shape-determining protein MreD n=1 Tax=Phaeovibrio sulfidiphilus TaxID=1220600 RepID=A0A8J7CWD4_9PROT|nr:rod shape-determining protein MreD [Phaeovibrio sulfidiphilus]MBE1237351.1 rod shape-determining protein MreD [Phaeovibrio sulfidiphilus]
MAQKGTRSSFGSDRPGLWVRLDDFLRALAPAGITLVLILISLTPSRLPFFVHVAPMLSLISVFFWAVTRPGSIGYGTAFLLGAAEDALTGAPLGSTSLVFLLMLMLVNSQARFFMARTFFPTWWVFSVVAVTAAVMKWGLVSLHNMHVMDLRAIAFCSLITIAIYPLFAWALGWVNVLIYRSPE